MQRQPEDSTPLLSYQENDGPTEAKFCSYQLEASATIQSLKKFRVYLLGMSFTIVTDCPAFATTMSEKDPSDGIARWALQLEDFQYNKREHRQGRNTSII